MKGGSQQIKIRLACSLLLLIPLISVGQDQISDTALQHAQELLRSTPLIDGHNDLPWLIREETGGESPKKPRHPNLIPVLQELAPFAILIVQ